LEVVEQGEVLGNLSEAFGAVFVPTDAVIVVERDFQSEDEIGGRRNQHRRGGGSRWEDPCDRQKERSSPLIIWAGVPVSDGNGLEPGSNQPAVVDRVQKYGRVPSTNEVGADPPCLFGFPQEGCIGFDGESMPTFRFEAKELPHEHDRGDDYGGDRSPCGNPCCRIGPMCDVCVDDLSHAGEASETGR